MDRLTPAERSAQMARIQSTNTAPERFVRASIHGLGYRYRLHARGLPGTPDVVLRRLRTVVFVHGCFWHRHSGCKLTTTPKTRRAFWMAKFEANVQRDRRTARRLRREGWSVITVWGCEIRDPERLRRRLASALQRAEATVAERMGRCRRSVG